MCSSCTAEHLVTLLAGAFQNAMLVLLFPEHYQDTERRLPRHLPSINCAGTASCQTTGAAERLRWLQCCSMLSVEMKVCESELRRNVSHEHAHDWHEAKGGEAVRRIWNIYFTPPSAGHLRQHEFRGCTTEWSG